MIDRERLRQADKHARRRWRAFNLVLLESYGQNEEVREFRNRDPWQRYRKLTIHCSRYCCGNPRRWFGQVTLQERRAPRVDDAGYD